MRTREKGLVLMGVCALCHETPQVTGVGVLFEHKGLQMFLPALTPASLCLQCTVAAYTAEDSLYLLKELQRITKEGFVAIDTAILSQQQVVAMSLYPVLIDSLNILYQQQMQKDVPLHVVA